MDKPAKPPERLLDKLRASIASGDPEAQASSLRELVHDRIGVPHPISCSCEACLERMRGMVNAHPSHVRELEDVIRDVQAPVTEAAFKVETLDADFIRVTITCRRPPARNAIPDQESRGAMAMPRAVWFMSSIVKGFALQLKKPVIARAMDTIITAASKEVDKVARAKAAYDAEFETDV